MVVIGLMGTNKVYESTSSGNSAEIFGNSTVAAVATTFVGQSASPEQLIASMMEVHVPLEEALAGPCTHDACLYTGSSWSNKESTNQGIICCMRANTKITKLLRSDHSTQHL